MTLWRPKQLSHTSWEFEDSASNFYFYHYAKKQNIPKDIFRDIFSDVLHKKDVKILPSWHVTFYVKLSILSRLTSFPGSPLFLEKREDPGNEVSSGLPRVLCLWLEQQVAWHRNVNVKIPDSRTCWNSNETWMSDQRLKRDK